MQQEQQLPGEGTPGIGARMDVRVGSSLSDRASGTPTIAEWAEPPVVSRPRRDEHVPSDQLWRAAIRAAVDAAAMAAELRRQLTAARLERGAQPLV